MKRYRGEDLPPNPRIAVIANDALGNFVAATPLLQMLRYKWEPCFIAYYGGTRTRELQESSDLFEQNFLLHGTAFRESVADALESPPFNLVVNLEQQSIARAMAAALSSDDTFVVGPSFNTDGRGDLPYADDAVGWLASDKEWLSESVLSNHPILESGFIAEIFCRLCYLEGPIPTYKVPTADPERPVPDLLLATAASLPEKLWPIEKWRQVISALLEKGHSVGLLGAKPSEQGKHWKGADEEARLFESGVEDLRGAWTLPQVVGAIENAKAVLTIDNGILHLAAATGTPTVGLFRHGIHRLWAPPFANLTVLTPGEKKAVAEIPVQVVQEAIFHAL
jgi:ADP-heptose:LPS heptosyltransferase